MIFTFATHNPNKVSEVRQILTDMDINILSLSDIGIHDEIIEDGNTLDENAWIKANYIHDIKKANVIAEDTGLEVDALDGAPGVYSARYAGAQKNSEDNMNLLLSRLLHHEVRTAQFRTVLAVWLDNIAYTFEGIVRGTIAMERQGGGGFGYDPIFVPEGYQESFGVLSRDIKNSISHRGRAFSAFKDFLEQGLAH